MNKLTKISAVILVAGLTALSMQSANAWEKKHVWSRYSWNNNGNKYNAGEGDFDMSGRCFDKNRFNGYKSEDGRAYGYGSRFYYKRPRAYDWQPISLSRDPLLLQIRRP